MLTVSACVPGLSLTASVFTDAAAGFGLAVFTDGFILLRLWVIFFGLNNHRITSHFRVSGIFSADYFFKAAQFLKAGHADVGKTP